MKNAVVLVLGAFLFGCGSGGDGGGAIPVDATGTWNGTVASTVRGTTSASLNMVQTSGHLTGTYTAGSTTGAVTGTMNGNVATVVISLNQQGCTGSYNGTGTVNPPTMSFSFNGSSTCGGNESGSGNLTKQ